MMASKMGESQILTNAHYVFGNHPKQDLRREVFSQSPFL